jgi:hypothetical protein
MKNIVKISKIQAKPFIEKTFPEYSGRKFFVEFEETVFFWDTNWGGGTRNVFKAMSFDGKVFGMNVPAPWKVLHFILTKMLLWLSIRFFVDVIWVFEYTHIHHFHQNFWLEANNDK